ncbi:hypothetical protein KEM52_005394, partial [Ascosphaera acerosa]
EDRGPTPSHAAITTYPTAPTVASSMIVYPRCCVRSATHVDAIVARKLAKNGGAVSPCALIDVNPMSFRMVGRKTGSEEKLTLQLKYINYTPP